MMMTNLLMWLMLNNQRMSRRIKIQILSFGDDVDDEDDDDDIIDDDIFDDEEYFDEDIEGKDSNNTL